MQKIVAVEPYILYIIHIGSAMPDCVMCTLALYIFGYTRHQSQMLGERKKKKKEEKKSISNLRE